MISLLYQVTYIILILLGYRKKNEKGLKYWIKKSTIISTQKRNSLLFFHGIGIGLLPYLFMILKISRNNLARDIILVELPFAKISLSNKHDKSINIKETVNAITAILSKTQLKQCICMGHSYGTIIMSWIIQLNPTLIHSAIFIDPVCFLLFFT